MKLCDRFITSASRRLPWLTRELSRAGARARNSIMPFADGGVGFPPARRPSRMHELIEQHQGRLLHKWAHYPAIYDQYFSRFVGAHVRVLEIGVSHGGSLEVLRKYLGPYALICGIDVDPRCKCVASNGMMVEIGSQADVGFLKTVVRKMGGVDIVIDDGSHIAPDQRISFETLFPLLHNGGVYLVEDVQTSYWPGQYEGGYRRRGTFVEVAKSMIDHMHHWYHNRAVPQPWMKSIASIHFYDGVVVFEKGEPEFPVHAKIGKPSF